MNKPDIELPPLPSPLGIVDPEGTEGMVQYTASDLANYAKAYAMDAIKPYQKRITELEAELEATGAGGVSSQRITSQRRGEPVAYFQNVNAMNDQPPLYEQVCASAKDDDDVFPLYATPQPAEPSFVLRLKLERI